MSRTGSRPALVAVLVGLLSAAACASAVTDDSPETTIGALPDAGDAGDAAHNASATGAGTGGAVAFPEAGSGGHDASGVDAVGGASAAGGSPAGGASAGLGTGGSPSAGGASAAGGAPGAGGAATGGTPGAGGVSPAGPGAGGSPSTGGAPAAGGTSAAGSATGPCAGKPDQTVCAPTSDPCQLPGLCFSGVCQPVEPQSDGTPCGGAPDACHEAQVCTSGVCGAASKPDGTVCNDPGNACVQAGVCSGGVCGAPSPFPDAHNYDAADPFARCCGGTPTKVTGDANCGGCGITCNASNGESCQARSNAGQTNYYCAGCVASAKCWSGCCSTSYPATMNVCAVSDCAGGCKDICPAGQHCVAGASVMMSNWCSY